jgi:hypothetical protein
MYLFIFKKTLFRSCFSSLLGYSFWPSSLVWSILVLRFIEFVSDIIKIMIQFLAAALILVTFFFPPFFPGPPSFYFKLINGVCLAIWILLTCASLSIYWFQFFRTYKWFKLRFSFTFTDWSWIELSLLLILRKLCTTLQLHHHCWSFCLPPRSYILKNLWCRPVCLKSIKPYKFTYLLPTWGLSTHLFPPPPTDFSLYTHFPIFRQCMIWCGPGWTSMYNATMVKIPMFFGLLLNIINIRSLK